MTTMTISETTVRLRFSAWENVAGLIRDHDVLVSVRRHQPAVRLRLAGQRFDEVLSGADDAAALADLPRAHVG